MSRARFTDYELLRLISQGDDQGLEECISRYEGKLYSLLRCVVGEGPESGEILAQTFLTLVRRIDSFPPDVCLSRELLKITVSEVTRFLDSGAIEVETPASSELNAAVFKLPVEYKLVLTIRDVLGVEAQACSELLEISLEESEYRLRRSRLMLRRALLRANGTMPTEVAVGVEGDLSQPKEILV